MSILMSCKDGSYVEYHALLEFKVYNKKQAPSASYHSKCHVVTGSNKAWGSFQRC